MITRIHEQLHRIGATDVVVSMDHDFDPEVGPLMKVQIGSADWHLFPETFYQLLGELRDGAGSDAVLQAIESKATPVWHGPEPQDGRR